jgi:hypothetical protein
VIPRGSRALGDIALKLAFAIAPETTSSFAAANTGLMTMLLQCLGQEFERAAQARLDDMNDVKAIFRETHGQVPAALSPSIEAFLASQPQSLRISDLDAWHGSGMALLIRVHADAEERGDSALEERIWGFLARHVERHAFALAGI